MNKSTLKNTIRTTFVTMASMAIVASAAYAWSGPPGAPPNPNAAPPINTSATNQTKSGAIGATSFYDANDGSYYLDPNGTSVFRTTYDYARSFSLTDDWAYTTYGAGWAQNAQPMNSRSSIYTNDIYLRSISKWVSQIGKAPPNCNGTLRSDASGNIYCHTPLPPQTMGAYGMPGGSGANCQTHTVSGVPAGSNKVNEHVRWYDHGWFETDTLRASGGGTSHTSGVYCIHQGGYITYTFYYN